MPLKVYQDYIRESERWTASLGWWHSVAYGYAVSLRSAPLYSAWSAGIGWGDASVLRDSQNFAAQFLRRESFADAAVEDCYRRLEAVIPDSETFEDCSAATDTGIIHLYTLSLLRRYDPAETQYIASYCYELVDDAAGAEVIPSGYCTVTPEHEIAIEGHPFVQAEVAWQQRGRSLLSTITEYDYTALGQFIADWTTQPIIRRH
jgi:Protein of unknown function (DUF416)